jgi:O-antigen biosynthesis protein
LKLLVWAPRFALLLLNLLLVPPLLLLTAGCMALGDLFWRIFGSRKLPADTLPRTHAASVVIPSWNTKDLLAEYLPSVIAAMQGHADNEIIVVDNGSKDGSADFVRATFPQVRVLALPDNLGFGGGSNAGFAAARNDIVVLLNSDMRVAPDFLNPLLAGFHHPGVFAVACQIFFSDPKRLREETGLTQGWWEGGALRVRHRNDDQVKELFPCFYPGGGSAAFDRRKFLELGGFDDILRPFYYEDTDLGYLAWKRGWQVFYQPASHVWHEHRGTIGRNFNNAFINGVLKKNALLFVWKNVHQWKLLLRHFPSLFFSSAISAIAGDSPERSNLRGIFRAVLQLPELLHARWRTRGMAAVSDEEAFRRPLGGYFRDRFHEMPAEPARPHVLMLSPYPLEPPHHGGAVFMNLIARELVKEVDLHLIALLDYAHQREEHAPLAALAASFASIVRLTGQRSFFGSIEPHAVMEFRNDDLAWLIHRTLFTQRIDLLQIEYANMGQYGGGMPRIPTALFEHDVYFQSVRSLLSNSPSAFFRFTASMEYLRAIFYEIRMLRRMERIQVCTRENGDYLASFAPELQSRIRSGLRAVMDTSRYPAQQLNAARDPATLLFLGNFRHTPNLEGVQWLVREVFPLVRQARPDAKLLIVGAEPPPAHSFPSSEGLEVMGFVPDLGEVVSRASVFVCPIRSGSGVRVKLLEAFAAGIPSVSTHLGAEGLAQEDGSVCLLADDPALFAAAILRLLSDRAFATAMATRARAEVVENWDAAHVGRKLVADYRAVIRSSRSLN